MKKLILCAVAGVVLLGLSGCAALTKPEGGLFLQRVVAMPAITNTSPSGDYVVTPGYLATNFVVNPSAQQSIQAIKEANGILNPTPSAPLVNMGLTALSGILGIVAAWKTRKANQNATVADLLIESIETANKPEVKAAIEQLSLKRGKADLVHSKVKQITKGNK